MSQFAIQMRQISKNYNGFLANKEISFNLKKGSIHAIAGENGAGKSTLMKILFGLEQPERGGEILVQGKSVKFSSPLEAIANGIGMVQQHFALSGVISALENVILGAEPSTLGIIKKDQALKKIKELAGEELSLPWDRPTHQLAVGQQQRIEILKLLFRNAEVLILDEPTGVLAPQEIESFFNLLRKLRDQGRSIIIITHKLEEIFSLCDEVTVLKQGQWVAHAEVKNYSKSQLIEAMIGRPLKTPEEIKLKNFNDKPVLVELKNTSVHKKGRGGLKNLSLQIRQGEILGVAGVEGNGQQSLVEVLLGLRTHQGEVQFGSKKIETHKTNVRKNLNFGLICEDRHNQSLWLDQSVWENCLIGVSHKFSTLGFIQKKLSKKYSDDILSSFDVRMQNLDQPIKSLSGGNQQKVVIAREIKGRKPKFLIASQPTRGVDIGAIEAIHEAIKKLADSGSAVLLISSELEEVCKLSDRVVVLYEGSIAGEFEGPHYEAQKIGAAMTGKGIKT